MSAPVLRAGVPVLPVARITQAVRFWTERLGFAARHAEGGYAVLARDDVEVHLWHAGDEAWHDRPGRPVESGAESFLAGTASCRILVSGIDALHARMAARSVVHPNGPLTDKPYGLREFAVRDDCGNLVTFFCPAEPKRG
ncbi:MAG: bleomycin resistance protein [Paracoccaceae bacterium]